MKTTTAVNETKTNGFLNLYLEYSSKATTAEKEYRELEHKFTQAFGYPPIQVANDLFTDLLQTQQRACVAFWQNKKVVDARREMEIARTLAETYFDAFADRSK